MGYMPGMTPGTGGILTGPASFPGSTLYSAFSSTGVMSFPGFSGTFASLTSIPSTLSGYGITDAQPLDADLTAIAALATTAFGRGLLAEASAATARSTLGLAIGSNVQAWDADLDSIAALTTTAFGRGLLTETSATTARSTLGVAIGSNVQAWGADLDALAALAGTNTIYYRSAANTWSAVTIGANLTFSGGTLAATGGGSATWGSITGTLSSQTDLQTALNGLQPLDADLTAIAALATTAFGRGLLTEASASTARSTLGFNTGTANQVAYFAATGTLISGTAGFTFDGTLLTAPIFNVGTTTYTPPNSLVRLQSSVNSYNQVVIQNSNAGTTASSNLVVNNDQSTDATFFGEIGMNSSGFTGSGAFNTASAVYLSSTSVPLVLGTTTAHSIRFTTNNSTSDWMSIASTGKVTLSASTTARAPFNIPTGVAPTSPADGDIWATSAGAFIRAGGVTIGPFGTGGGGSTNNYYAIAMGW